MSVQTLCLCVTLWLCLCLFGLEISVQFHATFKNKWHLEFCDSSVFAVIILCVGFDFQRGKCHTTEIALNTVSVCAHWIQQIQIQSHYSLYWKSSIHQPLYPSVWNKLILFTNILCVSLIHLISYAHIYYELFIFLCHMISVEKKVAFYFNVQNVMTPHPVQYIFISLTGVCITSEHWILCVLFLACCILVKCACSAAVAV